MYARNLCLIIVVFTPLSYHDETLKITRIFITKGISVVQMTSKLIRSPFSTKTMSSVFEKPKKGTHQICRLVTVMRVVIPYSIITIYVCMGLGMEHGNIFSMTKQ